MRLRTFLIALLLAIAAACAAPDAYDIDGPRPDAGLGGTGIAPTLPQ